MIGPNESNMKSLNLKVQIESKSGFCFGVINAIQIAEEYLKTHGELYCLGDIVHNDREIERLEKLGLKTITHKEFNELRNETVLLRAHGEPPETYRKAFEHNIHLIDASCPVVLRLQNKVKKLSDPGETPVFIFGKKGHAEVVGLLGQVTNDNARVFQSLDELKKEKLPDEMILISQTTRDTDELLEIKKYIEEQGVQVDFHNSICGQVSNRKKELKDFVKSVDIVVFVAGTKSSNGRVLYEVCKRNNPRSHFVSDQREIELSWFKENDRVGVCGATSTPKWLMKNVKAVLQSY